MEPEDWKKHTFLELISSGDILGIQDGNHGNDHPKASDYQQSGVPFIMARDLKGGTVDISNCCYISKKQASALRIGFAKPEDILISHKGTIGEVAIVPSDYEYLMLTPQVTYYRVNPNGKLSNKYLFQYFLSSNFQKTLENISAQSTRSYIGITAQKELSIIFPDLAEQTKIAQILSTWDKAIATTERLLANSQQQKQALMQQLLTGQKRFAEFRDQWSHQQLGDIATIVMGSSPRSESYNGNGLGLPLLQGNADIDNRRSSPRIFTSQITKECNPGDILLSVRAPVGHVALSAHHACIGRGIAGLFAHKEHDQSFLYQWLIWFEPQWENISQGSTFESVNSNDIRSLKVMTPHLPEQQKIAQVLSTADAEITNLQAQLAKLKLEKKALMQQLLTGQRRVKPDADAAAP